MQWRSSYVQWIQRTFIHATYWEVVALLIGNGSARSVHSVVGAGKLWSTSPSAPGRPSLVANPARKGTLSSIARTPPAVASRRYARTGGQRKTSGKLHVCARVSVASNADANNLSTQRRVLADCEQVFEDVGRSCGVTGHGCADSAAWFQCVLSQFKALGYEDRVALTGKDGGPVKTEHVFQPSKEVWDDVLRKRAEYERLRDGDTEEA